MKANKDQVIKALELWVHDAIDAMRSGEPLDTIDLPKAGALFGESDEYTWGQALIDAFSKVTKVTIGYRIPQADADQLAEAIERHGNFKVFCRACTQERNTFDVIVSSYKPRPRGVECEDLLAELVRILASC